MYNQDDFQKVSDNVIDPLKRHYGVKFDAEMIDDYVGDLRSYSVDILRTAVADIRRQEKRRPALAHILEACEKHKPRPAGEHKQSKPRFHCMGHAEVQHPVSTREILSSSAGQLALELGVARDFLIEYECSGKKDFTEADARKALIAIKGSIQALFDYRQKHGDLALEWERRFEDMQEREQRLYGLFYRRVA
jgi:hypothetical protein